MLALYRFDIYEAAWVAPSPALSRQAFTLIGRLISDNGRSLYASRLRKERDDGKQYSLAEKEAARAENPREYYGWDDDRWALHAVETQIALLSFRVASMFAAKGSNIEFDPPWAPGQPFTAVTNDEFSGPVFNPFASGFDPKAIGL